MESLKWFDGKMSTRDRMIHLKSIRSRVPPGIVWILGVSYDPGCLKVSKYHPKNPLRDYIRIRIHFKLYCFWLLFVYIFHTDKVGSKGNLHFSCTLVLHNGFEYISFLLDILYLIDKRCNSTYLSAHDIRIHYLHIFFRRNW